MAEKLVGDDRFEVIGEAIDGGGQGVVYVAEDTMYNRQVAIKVLKTETSTEMTFLRKLLRDEARLQVKLSSEKNPHPNIVYILDVRSFEGEPAIVMEYVDGGNVYDMMGPKTRRKPVTLEEFFEITRQICEGLAFAHAKGIIHRDIKPKNVLIQKSDRVVKIIDWGVAKNIDIAGRGRTFAGTPPYMSPEVVLLNRRSVQDRLKSVGVDHRTDIYSLGVTMFELLTAGLPFKNPLTREEDILAGVNDQHDRFLRGKGIAPALVAITLKAMARDPDRRYQTTRALQEALHNCQEEILPRPKPAPEPKPSGEPKPAPDFAIVRSDKSPADPAALDKPSQHRTSLEKPSLDKASPEKPTPDKPSVKQHAKVEDALKAAWTPARAETPDYVEAERRFQEVLKLHPENQTVYQELARFYIIRMKDNQAIAILNKGIEVAPSHASLWLIRGDLYDIRGETAAAIRDLEQALQLGLPPREVRMVNATLARLNRS